MEYRLPLPIEASRSLPSGSEPSNIGTTIAEVSPISLSAWNASWEETAARSISSVISSVTMGRFSRNGFSSAGPASHRLGGTSTSSFFANSRCRGSGW